MFDAIKEFFSGPAADKIKERWHSIEDEEAIDDLVASSNTTPQVIYKHSSRCSVSFFALKNLHELEEGAWNKADYYMVDVIGQRGLSAKVAEKLNVRHESPQLLILKDGEIAWHGSHYQVKAEAVEGFL